MLIAIETIPKGALCDIVHVSFDAGDMEPFYIGN